MLKQPFDKAVYLEKAIPDLMAWKEIQIIVRNGVPKKKVAIQKHLYSLPN